MDFQLRCNHLRCREKLKDKAVVTTCSHIFCLACSDSSTLGSGEIAGRSCPACGTILGKPFDVTVAILRPTDDYKMSILSGLSPTIIMECANSGMAFWAYQSSQEIYYQEHANKSLKQQLDVKNQELSGVKASARDEIGKLEESLQDASDKINKLSRSLAELEEGRKSLERDRNKFRVSYEKLKQKALVPDIENAAEENAAYAAQGGDYGSMHPPHSRTGSDGSGGRRPGNDFFGAPNNHARNGLQSARKFNGIARQNLTNIRRRTTCTDDAFCPSPTASIGIRYSRIPPGTGLHAFKHSCWNSIPSTAGKPRPECVRCG
jgi:E3 ubiquitin-protein ligase CCNP1IP1